MSIISRDLALIMGSTALSLSLAVIITASVAGSSAAAEPDPIAAPITVLVNEKLELPDGQVVEYIGGGSEARAITVSSGGTLTGTDMTITSDGFGTANHSLASVIRADPGSTVELTGGSVSATGNIFTRGILGDGDGTEIRTSDTDISTTGNNSHALHVINGASATVTGGAITTAGNNSFGLYSQNGSHLTAENVTINSSGVNGFGVFTYDGNSFLKLSDSSITTENTRGHGVVAGQDTTIVVSDTEISTKGRNAWGIVADQTGTSVIADNVDITTEGDWAYGVYANGLGTDTVSIELEGGTIETWGERAYGLLSAQGATISSSAEITTHGLKGHGVQAGANGSSGDGSDGSVITLVPGASVTTKGSDAFGLHAIDGGKIEGTVNIATENVNGFGAFAESYSTIDLHDSEIITKGAKAHGLIANNDRLSGTNADSEATGGKITATDVVVETSGANAVGAWSEAGADIEIIGGTIETWGERAYGLLSMQGATISSSAAITTHGLKGHGVQAGANGSSGDGSDGSVITLVPGASVTTTGSDAFGLHAIDGGKIEGTVNIETEGVNGFGAFAESYSTIDLHDSEIITKGAKAHGLIANNDRLSGTNADSEATGGKITATDVTVETSGANAVGAWSEAGADIYIIGGTIETRGERAYGLLSMHGATISSSAEITTHGLKGHGVQAGANGSSGDGSDGSVITLVPGASVTTTGSDAFGLHAIDGGKIEGTVNIETEGVNGFGAFAESYSTIDLHDSLIVTEGATAHGLIANNDRLSGTNADSNAIGGKITAKNLVVETSGAGAAGAWAEAGGDINIIGSTIMAGGENANALKIVNSGRITVEDTTLSSAEAATIGVTLNKAGSEAEVVFGSGTVALQNNGKLLQVSRSGDGSDGIVNFTLEAGSQSQGDIVDEGDKTSNGGTDVTLKEGASWIGRLFGVRDFSGAHGGSVAFEGEADIAGDLTGNGTGYTFSQMGGWIGGDVSLSDGSFTTGGSIDKRIEVGGNVIVDQTSQLGGNWQIGGDFTNEGTLSPGNSVGKVLVGGDLTLEPTSAYHVELHADGNVDHVDVAGDAFLGGSVRVTPLDGFQIYSPYTILTARTVDGGFGSVEFAHPSAFLTANVETVMGQDDRSDVNVTIERNEVSFASVAQNANQAAGAKIIDMMLPPSPPASEPEDMSFMAFDAPVEIPPLSPVALSVAALDASGAAEAFTQLSGEAHASMKPGLIETANLMADTVNNRLRSAFEGVAAKDAPLLSYARTAPGGKSEAFDAMAPVAYDYGVWATGFGSWIDRDGDANAFGTKSSVGGFVSGVDAGFASGWRLGVAGGYSQTSFHMKDNRSSAKSDNWHLGIYGSNQWGPVGLRAGLSNTWHSVDSSRSIAYPGYWDQLHADYNARTFQAFGEVSYRIDTASASFEPFANLSYANLHTDSFTEQGGAAALSVAKATMSTTFSTIGVRASAPVRLGTMNAKLDGALGWRHAYNGITPSSTHFFAGTSSFTVEGAAIARDTALVEAGLNLAITDASTLGLSYVGQFGSNTQQNGFNAKFDLKF